MSNIIAKWGLVFTVGKLIRRHHSIKHPPETNRACPQKSSSWPAVKSPEKPEGIRDAKGYLNRQMKMASGRTYVEVDNQPALADCFDSQLARQSCPSFDKFIREIETILIRL